MYNAVFVWLMPRLAWIVSTNMHSETFALPVDCVGASFNNNPSGCAMWIWRSSAGRLFHPCQLVLPCVCHFRGLA